MRLVETPFYKILFTGQQHSFKPQELWHITDGHKLRSLSNFSCLALPENIQIIKLKQTHSTHGFALLNEKDIQQYQPYLYEGDYLITNQKNIALAVATADCLPIIIYDPINHLIANIHAGWKGLANNIIEHALQHMIKIAPGNVTNFLAYMGPCARACCYQVQPDFFKHIPQQFCIQKNNLWYFDLVSYAQHQLQNLSIPSTQIDTTNALCTIEHQEWCSFRRDKHAFRQMTFVWLK